MVVSSYYKCIKTTIYSDSGSELSNILGVFEYQRDSCMYGMYQKSEWSQIQII